MTTRLSQPRTTTNHFDPSLYTNGSLRSSEVLEIKEQFDLFDLEHVGSINPRQLKAAMQALGFDGTNQAIYQLICDFDADGSGNIGFEDFLHLMTHRVTETDSRENLKRVFALYDDEKTGYISIKNLRRLAKDIGEDVQQNELQQMIERADKDKDGYVSSDEFYQLITRISFK